MERLWQLTDQDGCEHGACIVLDEHDRLRLDHEVVGTSQGVKPEHQAGDYADHLGFFHTHPLYPWGAEQVGFSEADFAGALEGGDWLSVARSGSRVFALVRTEKGRARGSVSPKDMDEFFAVFQKHLDDDKLTESEAQRQATLELCYRSGFALYVGEFGQPLRRELTS